MPARFEVAHVRSVVRTVPTRVTVSPLLDDCRAVLPRSRRLHRADQFRSVSRSGVRVRRGSLVVHVLRRPDVPEFDGIGSDVGGARAGLVVGRGVGNSVVRHRVSRRLRAQLALVLDDLPADWEVVVRATPDAATALSAALRSDLRGALDTARRKLPAVGGVRV